MNFWVIPVLGLKPPRSISSLWTILPSQLSRPWHDGSSPQISGDIRNTHIESSKWLWINAVNAQKFMENHLLWVFAWTSSYLSSIYTSYFDVHQGIPHGHFLPSTATAQHCCASRITAENPDEGFKPTSGKINSIRWAERTLLRVLILMTFGWEDQCIYI